MTKEGIPLTGWISDIEYLAREWEDQSMTGEDLDSTFFNKCKIKTTRLNNCFLKDILFEETVMEESAIKSTHLQGWVNEGPGARFEDVVIKDSSVTDGKFSNVVFSDVKISDKTIFTGCLFEKCTFIRCTFRSVRFDQCRFSDVTFDDCLFSGIYSRTRSHLSNTVTFSQCDFDITDFLKCTVPVRHTRHGAAALSPEGRKALKFKGCNTSGLTVTGCKEIAGLDRLDLTKDNFRGKVDFTAQHDGVYVSSRLSNSAGLETTVSAPTKPNTESPADDAQENYAALYGGWGDTGSVDGYDDGAYNIWNQASKTHRPTKHAKMGFLFVTTGV